ncbi:MULTISPECIES: hypothetical protein [unclassified Mycolicibacterium]|nr:MULTISPECIES: hypothetical protein [unclassified Mycolicibacterium]
MEQADLAVLPPLGGALFAGHLGLFTALLGGGAAGDQALWAAH